MKADPNSACNLSLVEHYERLHQSLSYRTPAEMYHEGR